MVVGCPVRCPFVDVVISWAWEVAMRRIVAVVVVVWLVIGVVAVQRNYFTGRSQPAPALLRSRSRSWLAR